MPGRRTKGRAPYQRLLGEALLVERRKIHQLRNERFINYEAQRRIQRDLDFFNCG